jgi:hypothetical protein
MVPSAPRALTATVSPKGGITLTWSAPLSTGGSSSIGYRIYRGTTSGGETLYSASGGFLTYTDSGVARKSRYFYTVTAFNSAGEGPFSNEVSVTSK